MAEIGVSEVTRYLRYPIYVIIGGNEGYSVALIFGIANPVCTDVLAEQAGRPVLNMYRVNYRTQLIAER